MWHVLAGQRDRTGPRPLRDAANLWGFKNLAEPDAGRVKSADAIYKSAAALCKHVLRCHPRVGLSIENPTNSWMWQLPGFAELAKQMTVVTFAACRHGSKRDKSTSILTNVTAMEDLAGPCPGGHVHAKWGWQHTGFATAEKAAYPRAVADVLPASRASVRCQPKARRLPPLVSEFAFTVAVKSDAPPVLDDKNCLRQPWLAVPAHAKLLRESFERGGKGSPKHSGDVSSKVLSIKYYTFGVYRTPAEYFLDFASI